MRHGAAFWGVLAAASCGGELPSPSTVDKLRLFALTTETPQVAPNTDVSVRAVWFDGSPAAGRDVHFLWRVCPVGPENDSRTCLQPSRGMDLAEGGTAAGGTPDVVTIPTSALPFAPLSGGDPHLADYFLFVAICPLSAPQYDAASGQYQCPSEASVPFAQREGIQAVRRIGVRDDGVLNHDPTIARVLVNGAEVAADGGTVAVPRCPVPRDGDPPCTRALRLEATPDSAETIAGDPPTRETLVVSFFATAGSIDRPRAVASADSPTGADGALSAQWTAPTSAGSARLWFVLRDDRGGEVAREVLVDVQ